MTRRYYDWNGVFSRQTGTTGEIAIIVGAKNIGKTFGLRKRCIEDYIKTHGKHRFCEICRTKEALKDVRNGYFDKLQAEGLFSDYVFQTHGNEGQIAKVTGHDEKTGKVKHTPWDTVCYFVSLSGFQNEKQRTYAGVYRFIFDEALIDSKDKYHRYLNDEFLILANVLDSVSRQQPGGAAYRVYLLGNAVDLTCPYFSQFGIVKPPDFGMRFYNKKHVLLDYVEPWDAEDMKARTLVGRMLAGDDESEVIYDNVFADRGAGEIARKSANARYLFAVKYGRDTLAVWPDHRTGLYYITRKIPKDAGNVYTLTKRDASVDLRRVEKASPLLQLINKGFYANALRYDSPAIREKFLAILDFCGIR